MASPTEGKRGVESSNQDWPCSHRAAHISLSGPARPPLRGREGAALAWSAPPRSPARSSKRSSALGRVSALQTARCGSERRSERRPASEICGSPNRPGNCRWRLPCIHENALLRVGRLDNGRPDDGSGPAGGEMRDATDPREKPLHSSSRGYAKAPFPGPCCPQTVAGGAVAGPRDRRSLREGAELCPRRRAHACELE